MCTSSLITPLDAAYVLVEGAPVNAALRFALAPAQLPASSTITRRPFALAPANLAANSP